MSESNDTKVALVEQSLEHMQKQFDQFSTILSKFDAFMNEQKISNQEVSFSMKELRKEFESNSVTLKDYKQVKDRVEAAGYIGKLLWGGLAGAIGLAIWFKDAWLQLVVR